MDEIVTGGCLCGAIRYELRVGGPLGPLVNCHCHFCRRAHGAAFVTSLPIATRRLRIVQGEDAIARSEARYFCGTCGTRLFNRLAPQPELTMLMVSSLDEQPETEPALHVNLESKAPWYVIRDDAPRYDGFPPGTVDEPRGRRVSPNIPAPAGRAVLQAHASWSSAARPLSCPTELKTTPSKFCAFCTLRGNGPGRFETFHERDEPWPACGFSLTSSPTRSPRARWWSGRLRWSRSLPKTRSTPGPPAS